jgi:hypothetical protein
MNNEMIEQIALANGFKLKKQPDGSMALNPYVYDFARALLATAEIAPEVGLVGYVIKTELFAERRSLAVIIYPRKEGIFNTPLYADKHELQKSVDSNK